MEGWAFSFLLSLNSDFQDLKVCRGASGWRRCGEGVCFGSGFFERFEIMLLGVGGKKVSQFILFSKESVLIALRVKIGICG